MPFALPLISALLVMGPDLDKYIYPMAMPQRSPEFTIDVKDIPELEPWAQRAAKLATTWCPALTAMLATENYKAPKSIRFVFKKTLAAPAWTAGNEITFNGQWVTQHPEDFGMVIHELTHIVQGYPDSDKTPGWLVEGIADYIRWWRYEPEAPRPRINKEKNNYTDSYRTTAYWLAWVGQKYDMRLVPALDRKMRAKEDPLPVFKDMTGKEPDELWKEFIATLP